MTDSAKRTWPEPPVAGDETATLLGSLERQRATIGWKCGGLDSAGLRARIGASTITLGGLLKHLAHVEDLHFGRLLLNESPGAPWDSVDWAASPDWDWESAALDTPEELMTLWRAACARSRALVSEVLITGDMGTCGKYVTRTGESPALRRVLIDMIEEYARHAGHADLIREAVDGLVGKDPLG